MKNDKQWKSVVGFIIIMATSMAVVFWVGRKYQVSPPSQQPIATIPERTEQANRDQANQQANEEEKPVDTSNWKTCRSEKYGYEFKYPDTWEIHVPVNRTITDCSNFTSLIVLPKEPTEGLQKASFSFIKNGPSMEEFISSKDRETIIEKKIQINGRKAIITRKDGPRGVIRGLLIFDNQSNYGLGIEAVSSDALFEAFISNFRIIN